MTRPCPCDLHLATRLLNRGPRPDAGQVTAPGGGLDARYEQPRYAALHARAQAFPLGLGVLTGKGVTAWQRALASLAVPQAPSGRPPGAAPAHLPALPAPAAAELISALAAVSTGTIKIWHHAGLLTGHPYNDKGQCLYPPPGPNPPARAQGRKLSRRRPAAPADDA